MVRSRLQLLEQDTWGALGMLDPQHVVDVLNVASLLWPHSCPHRPAHYVHLPGKAA